MSNKTPCICRVCLKGNTKTYSVVNTQLQVMYENLTNNKLVTKDGRPDTVCSTCLWTLINCCKFKEKSGKSGDILEQLSKHGIEILPETLSAMKRGIKQEYSITTTESSSYGGLYGNIVVKKEIKTESEPDLIPPVEDLSPNAKLCRVCLAVSTRTYNKLGQLQPLYEKITDLKLNATASDQNVCYLCCARLRRCKELVSKATKSEKIMAELARNGIQLSQETVNIINRKIESRFTISPVETFTYKPNDTKSVIVEGKKSRAVESNIETMIKKERDQNYDELDQNFQDLGQYCEQLVQNCGELGQSTATSDQNVKTPYQSCKKSVQSSNKAGQSGYKTSQSGDVSDQSGDKSEQNGDGTDPSGNESDQSGDESDQSGDESDQSGDKSEENGDRTDPSGDESHQSDDNPGPSLKELDKTDESDQSDKEADLNYGEIGDNCKVCKAKLDSQEKVERHKRLHDPKRGYACNRCTYRYEVKSHLDFHKRTHRYNNKCKVCGKSFTHIRLLQRHMWMHSGNVYKCKICDVVFRYGYEISKHNLAKHPEVDFDCKFCKKAFTAEHRLFEHVFKDHARDFPHFTCDYCRRNFTDLPVLVKHMNFVHLKSFKHHCDKCRRNFSKLAALKEHKLICYKKEEVVYKCDMCPKSYLHRHSLIRHEIIHTGERNFKCQICDKAFKDKYAIKNHMKCHNSDSIRLTCDFCEKTYLNKHLYQEHVMTHITGIKKPYSCDECYKNFTTKYQLNKHKKQHSEKPKDKPKYECKICNKEVVSLSTHMRVHSDNKPYACDVCDMAFRHRQNLMSHKASHGKDRPFICNKCGKSFPRKPSLKNHILNMHSDRVKPHVCMHCDKAFGSSIQLKVHMRSHTGEKPYKCDKCHKKFSELRGLKLHEIREHSNVKKTNFICDLCHKVYLEKKDIIRHLKTHKGKRNFRCNVCNKLFLDMFTLFWHLKTHPKKSVKEHNCMFCKQSFSNKLILNRHYIGRHGGYKEYACNICEEGYLCYQNLGVHIQRSHKSGYQCSLCYKMYTSQRQLLKHMINLHGYKRK